MECPVCGNTKISPFATHCLDCGTDVVAYPLLEDLEQQCVDTLKDKIALEGDMNELLKLRKKDKDEYGRKISRMYWFLLLIPLLFFWYGKKNIVLPAEIVDNPELVKSVEYLEVENTRLEKELAAANAEILSLKNNKEITHIVEKGESLSVLAGKYLKDPNRWKEIHEYNPDIKNPWLLTPGEKVLIKIN